MNAFLRRHSAATSRFLFSIAVLGGVAITSDVQAETLRVCAVAAGKCHYTTVQEAVDAAESGGIIQIGPGVFDESVTVIQTKDLTIKGAGVTRTILYGGPSSRPPPGKTDNATFSCRGGATVRIDNVTMTHHHNATGAGMRNYDCTMTVKNSTIQNNTALTLGGGIYSSGIMTLENVDVQNNSGELGGGILNVGTMTIKNSHIQNNSAHGPSGPVGGGILNWGGTLILQDSDVSNNDSLEGGGISNSGNLLLRRSTIHWNFAYNGGGGGIWNSGIVELANSLIDLNYAAVQGGGIFEAGGMIMDTAGETWYVDNKPNHCANATGEIPCR